MIHAEIYHIKVFCFMSGMLLFSVDLFIVCILYLGFVCFIMLFLFILMLLFFWLLFNKFYKCYFLGSLFCKYKQKNQTKFHPKRTSFNRFNTNKEMFHYCLRTQNWQYYILTKIFVNGYNHAQFFPR